MSNHNKKRFASLDDFLKAEPLTVDGILDDGGGSLYSVKGREIIATVLFADISSFSARTLELNGTETLAFVNHFFTWTTAEALRNTNGIIDKYIGDEIMIDPFKESLMAAKRMAENDVFSFRPHIGIASGEVTVGWVGTPLKYDCSVFGKPASVASRCAGVKANGPPRGLNVSPGSIVFPQDEWREELYDEVFPVFSWTNSQGKVTGTSRDWELIDRPNESLKNIGTGIY